MACDLRVIDGVEMTADPGAMLEAGHVAPGVPMLLGSNRDEGSLFREQPDYLADEEMFDGWLNATLGEELADELRAEKIYTPETATTGLGKGGSRAACRTIASKLPAHASQKARTATGRRSYSLVSRPDFS